MSNRSLEILDKEEQSIRLKIEDMKKHKKAIDQKIEYLSAHLEDLLDAQRLIKLYSPEVMLSGRDIRQMQERDAK